MGSGNAKKFEWKLGTSGLLVVIIGTAVLLCLSFLAGVGVGRNMDTYPEKVSSLPQRVLHFFWRPAKVAGPISPSDTGESQAEKGSKELVFHDALTRQKIPSIQQPSVEEKKDAQDVVAQIIANPPSAQEAEPPSEEAAAPEQVVAPPVAPMGRKTPVEKKGVVKETPVSGSSAATSYVLQVASLKEKKKALQIQKTVTEMGYSAKVVQAEVKGKGTWYRVMATGFASKAAARAAAGKIDGKAKTHSIIRPAAADVRKAGKN